MRIDAARSGFIVALVVLMPALAGASPIHPADEHDPVEHAPVLRAPIRHISARTVVKTPLSSEQMTVIKSEVAAIWSPYGVRVSWDTPASEEEEGTPVRVLFDDRASAFRRPRHASDPAIAAVQFPLPGVPREVVFVSPGAARMLYNEAVRRGVQAGERARVTARIIGRAIAHELGHFLLATANHESSGLMRPRFDVADVVADVGDRFRLDPVTVALLRHVNAVLMAQAHATRAGSG
jgi:hypothetical protein